MQDSSRMTEEALALWAEGKLTLREIKGYSEEELYAISHVGYFFLMQGKNEEARTLFEGLVAVDPRNDYYYRALGVIFQKLGEDDRALKQFAYAIRVHPSSPYAYVNRAEIYLSLNDLKSAEADLRDALARIGRSDEQLSRKAWALLKVVSSS